MMNFIKVITSFDYFDSDYVVNLYIIYIYFALYAFIATSESTYLNDFK